MEPEVATAIWFATKFKGWKAHFLVSSRALLPIDPTEAMPPDFRAFFSVSQASATDSGTNEPPRIFLIRRPRHPRAPRSRRGRSTFPW
jgi:hypothetical protein